MEKAEKIQILQDLIGINTVNGNELPIATYIQQLLAKHNITATIDEFGDGRANLQATIGHENADDKVLVFSGHQDTYQLMMNQPGNNHHLVRKLLVISSTVVAQPI